MAPQACFITLTANSGKENPPYEIPSSMKPAPRDAKYTGVDDCGHSDQRALTYPLPTAISIKLTKLKKFHWGLATHTNPEKV